MAETTAPTFAPVEVYSSDAHSVVMRRDGGGRSYYVRAPQWRDGVSLTITSRHGASDHTMTCAEARAIALEHNTDPAASTVSAVPLWGIDWICSFGDDGRLALVKIKGRWFNARQALRDLLCDLLERAYEEMPA